MRILFAVLLLVAGAARGFAQTAIVGDAWILGKVMVGTTIASARMTVVPSSATDVAFQVSGVDLTPFLRVAKDGTVGLSTYSAAHLDVSGSADSADIGIELRSGNLYGAVPSRTQIAFGQNGTTSRGHSITTLHADATSHNSIDFFISTGPSAGQTVQVMSLVTSTQVFRGGVHVRPPVVGEIQNELTVSNGVNLGGGTIHVAQSVTPSSRRLKTDIAYLPDQERGQAYENVRVLKPASFRYMRLGRKGYERDRKAPMHRGLIYEDAPASVRGPGDSLSMDQRLLESEMAFQELARRLEGLEKEVSR